MATTSQSREAQELMAYLTKKLGLPANLVALDLRIAVDEVVTITVTTYPRVRLDEEVLNLEDATKPE
ncbi:hypothetical protein D3C71_1928200 [compost metagenome]